MIILSDIPFVDENTFSKSIGKGVSFREFNPIYHEIKKWIDLSEDSGTEIMYRNTSELRETIVEKLSRLLSKKDTPPENVPNWVLKKWYKENPGNEIEILGKKIVLGGTQLMKCSEDREIIIYKKMLDVINSCIDKKKPLYISIKDDNCN